MRVYANVIHPSPPIEKALGRLTRVLWASSGLLIRITILVPQYLPIALLALSRGLQKSCFKLTDLRAATISKVHYPISTFSRSPPRADYLRS